MTTEQKEQFVTALEPVIEAFAQPYAIVITSDGKQLSICLWPNLEKDPMMMAVAELLAEKVPPMFRNQPDIVLIKKPDRHET